MLIPQRQSVNGGRVLSGKLLSASEAAIWTNGKVIPSAASSASSALNAYLAIEQNLYIVIKDKEERKSFEVENSNSDSKKYETNSEYVWKYIKIGEKDGKKKWNLKNVDPDISRHIKDVKWEEYIKL